MRGGTGVEPGSYGGPDVVVRSFDLISGGRESEVSGLMNHSLMHFVWKTLRGLGSRDCRTTVVLLQLRTYPPLPNLPGSRLRPCHFAPATNQPSCATARQRSAGPEESCARRGSNVSTQYAVRSTSLPAGHNLTLEPVIFDIVPARRCGHRTCRLG